MLDEIGARTINYVDGSGNEGVIHIAVSSRGNKRTALGGGAVLEEVIGAVIITSEPITHEIELTGIDDIQLVFRLLWMADLYVQTRFRERGLEVYKNVPGDVDRAFGIYN